MAGEAGVGQVFVDLMLRDENFWRELQAAQQARVDDLVARLELDSSGAIGDASATKAQL